jgi:putative membrane protein
MMGYYGGGMNGLAWMGMGLFWLALLGLIVWLVIRLLPGTSRETGAVGTAAASPAASAAASAAGPALAILDERLASGEVDVEMYRTIRATLLEGREGKR